MDLSRLTKMGDEGGIRRFPILLHLALSAAIAAILALLQPYIFPLLSAFNQGALAPMEMFLAFVLAVPIFAVFHLGLASTKAIIDWLLDGH